MAAPSAATATFSCFLQLPAELQLHVISHMLDAELEYRRSQHDYKVALTFDQRHGNLSVKGPRIPSIFHINHAFRSEALRLVRSRDLLFRALHNVPDSMVLFDPQKEALQFTFRQGEYLGPHRLPCSESRFVEWRKFLVSKLDQRLTSSIRDLILTFNYGFALRTGLQLGRYMRGHTSPELSILLVEWSSKELQSCPRASQLAWIEYLCAKVLNRGCRMIRLQREPISNATNHTRSLSSSSVVPYFAKVFQVFGIPLPRFPLTLATYHQEQEKPSSLCNDLLRTLTSLRGDWTQPPSRAVISRLARLKQLLAEVVQFSNKPKHRRKLAQLKKKQSIIARKKRNHGKPRTQGQDRSGSVEKGVKQGFSRKKIPKVKKKRTVFK
ncbi:hypothetical protein BDV96DRAFT_607487 [Lophiotrema nucula]|uniref:2EXR domain-containing protein n=1 Tax=Lophiotrema nucula TaxID=690887 RepID=A0A6A5YGN6_9PLEO|nr:hypothetical protein BDV96DRAFT_607487 [Lophiotrema nucula]